MKSMFTNRGAATRPVPTAVRIGITTMMLVAAGFAAGPSVAHQGHMAGPAPAAASYVPYLGEIGDPDGLTASGRRFLVADAGHGSIDAGNPLAGKVRAVNERFADVATAVAEGYAPIPCVSGIEGGAMGIHYVNGKLIEDEVVDIARPEAVMYEPQADGSMQLVAVEYITTKGPAALEGHLFSFSGAPNRYGLPAFYELHVWAWRDNPTGTFADMNPTVSCDAAVAGSN